jgi:hypothetical protein
MFLFFARRSLDILDGASEFRHWLTVEETSIPLFLVEAKFKPSSRIEGDVFWMKAPVRGDSIRPRLQHVFVTDAFKMEWEENNLTGASFSLIGQHVF